jgi:predicted dehydrogenase
MMNGDEAILPKGKADVGVIGVGWWSSQAHLPALSMNENAHLAAIADLDIDKLKQAKDTFNISKTYTDYIEMFEKEDLDGVVIAVPHKYHYEIALAALEHNLHVMIEKPMVLEVKHGEELLEVAEKNNLEIIVGYPWHYNKQVEQVQDWLSNGLIGDLMFVDCIFASIVWELYRGNPEAYKETFGFPVMPGSATYSDPTISGGGQAQTQITHSAGLLFKMTGLTPKSVFSIMKNFDLAVDLTDALVVNFDNDVIGTIASTGGVLNGQDEILEYKIFGNKGHILFDVIKGVASLHNKDGVLENRLEKSVGASIGSQDFWALSYPEHATSENLVNIILNKDVNRSPGSLGLQVVKLLVAAYRSTQENKLIEIN